jgi:hypothetical protein
MKLQPEGARRRLQVSRQGLGTGVGRVDEERNDGRRGHQLMQQFQPLRSHLDGQRGDACEVDIARRGWHGRKVPTAVFVTNDPTSTGNCNRSRCHLTFSQMRVAEPIKPSIGEGAGRVV